MSMTESIIAKNPVKVFVLNCGSSSLKYKLISMPSGREILRGEVQRIAAKTSEPSRIIHHFGEREEIFTRKITGYNEAFSEVMKLIESEGAAAPDFFAHRFVHGGTEFRHDTIITREDIPALNETRDLAPMHNPPVIELISLCAEKYPDVQQAIILDTAFHSTIPQYAATYPLPENVRGRFGIRKYGFHGISHQYVSEEAAKHLGIPIERFNAVSCHLGSGGASLCAIVGGKSADNSMGFSPLQGLVMSTRCGDLDPAIILNMVVHCGGDYSKVNKILNKESGVLGLSGTSSDIRDVIKKMISMDDDQSQTTLEVYLWRIRKYLGAYLAVVGDVDALIFTDTIGESIPIVRESACRGLDYFGVKLDEWKNTHVAGFPSDVSAADSRVHILVVKTDEEIAIARRAYRLVTSGWTGSEPADENLSYHSSESRESVDEKIDCANS